MISHSENKLIKMRKLITTLILLSIIIFSSHAVEIPEGFNKDRLVNDIAGVLNSAQQQQLEQKLDNFARTTSTQILVVTLKTLNGESPAIYAAELGHKLGVGQKDNDNGIVVLVKEKTANEGGQVSIQNGYGIEYIVTDALSKRIIENEMIPAFRQNNYYAGIGNAVNVLIDLTKGAYTADQYIASSRGGSEGFPGGIIFLFFAFIIFVKIISAIFGARRMKNSSLGRRSDLPFFLLLLSSLNSGGRHSGSWSSFNSGSGSFGGFSGGGGFGGFGGGGFGGGGASGSW